MARPKKNSADYFSHDNGMRNDRKIKALRSKYGMLGYGIWCMLLEYLTGCDDNEMIKDDLELELVSGDFGVSVTEMTEVIDYCIRLKLLVYENNVIYSKSLKDRLAPVYDKRARSKRNYRQKQQEISSFCDRNKPKEDVSVAEMTQSKVKESKVNNTIQYIESDKVILPEGLKRTLDSLLSDSEQTAHWRYTIARNNRIEPKEKLKDYLNQFFGVLANRGEIYKDETDAKFHFANWLTRLRKEKDEKTKYNNKPRKANRNTEGVKPAGIKSISLD